MKVPSLKAHFFAAALVVGLFAMSALAQAPRGGRHGGSPLGEGFDVLGFGPMHGDKLVKGAPFSATAVSETTHVLTDGNRIHRVTNVAISRDSEGRSRREVTLPAIGPLAAAGDAPQFVVIHDPVAGLHFVLDLKTKTATKKEMPSGNGDFSRNGPGKFSERAGDSSMLTTESLGTQVIEGVSAEGTRTTRTIPAGRIGNEKPIVIVSEVWYSPDLQIVVMTRRSDPRFGETVYKLTNIQRAEPSASLFQVPADFTVREGRGFNFVIRHGHKGAGSDAPPPPNEEL